MSKGEKQYGLEAKGQMIRVHDIELGSDWNVDVDYNEIEGGIDVLHTYLNGVEVANWSANFAGAVPALRENQIEFDNEITKMVLIALEK